MVLDQLREAGFDPDLTAGALSTIQTTRTTVNGSYAAAVASRNVQPAGCPPKKKMSQQEKQEDKFWECRRSLRLWPVKGG